MEPYVCVTNDVSLAVKSILQVKKAFRSQMKCIDQLQEQIKLLQEKISTLENRNKELTIFSRLCIQKEEMQKKLTQLKQIDVVHDSDTTCNKKSLDNQNEIISTEDMRVSCESDESNSCPASPPSSALQTKRKLQSKELTPRKNTSVRRSRRKLNTN